MKQKEFTRGDYKDLDFVGKKRLKEYRDGLAKELNQKRNTINSMLEGELDGLKGIEGLQGEYERAKKHAKNTAKIRRAWNILDTRDNARRKRFDESMKSIDRQFDVKDSIRKHEELAEKLRAKKALGKDLKKEGKVAAGTALAAGLIYGAKKLYDKNKNKDIKEQKEFAENLPMGTPKVSKEKASKLHDVLNRAKENIKKSKAGQKAADFYAKHEKGVKIGGGVAAGTALAAGLAVGAKKLANKKKEQQKEFTREDYRGLDESQQKILKKLRNKAAKQLQNHRRRINADLADNLKTNSKEEALKIANKSRHVALNDSFFNKAYLKHKSELSNTARKIKNRDAALGVAGVTALTAGLAYGGKKLYDKYKKNNESDNKD